VGFGGASTTSTGHARGCPWLGQGRPETPRHVRPTGHGGVGGTPDDDGRQIDGEGASGASDSDAGERCRERGRATRPGLGRGVGRMSGHASSDAGRISIRGSGNLYFFLFQREMGPLPRNHVRMRVTDGRPWWIIIENIN
jgi:hypothetical protein